MTIEDAIKKIKEDTKNSKFDQTVELHINLGIDVSKTDQTVRVSCNLPHGIGKEKKVILVTEEIIDQIVKGTLKPKVDFDAVVATPDLMPKLAKAAKILGPVGMMPNPKNGTVTSDPDKAISEIKKGQIELRNEKTAPVIHTAIGKVSFDEAKLAENYKMVIDTLATIKPAKLKGKFVKSITIKATQTKGILVD